MVRNDTSGMLATFLAGTGIPAPEIEEIIRKEFPGTDAAAVASAATGDRRAQTNQ
jgi:hypothetical protein